MRHGIIPVGLDAPAQPRHRFGVDAELQLSEGYELYPTEGAGIAGRQAERLVDMSFRLRPPTQIARQCIAHTVAAPYAQLDGAIGGRG